MAVPQSLDRKTCLDLENARPSGPAVSQRSAGREIHTTYAGDIRTLNDGTVTETLPLRHGIGRLGMPGDVALLHPGTYWLPAVQSDPRNAIMIPEPLVLRGLRGTPDNPIVIRGVDRRRVRLCGSNAATPIYPDLPDLQTFSFFKLIDCEGVVIEGMTVESCWPCFVYLEDCRYITLRDCTIRDGLYPVFARGDRTSHILIEDTDWHQDPTGTVFDTINWGASHHGDYVFLNGALFGSEKISGDIVLRNCTIKDCFNAIRIESATDDTRYRHNVNIEVTGCHFERVRDNVVEPEGHARNLWVHHNTIKNAHAWFSLDAVAGGYWYFFGNRGHFTERPGQLRDANAGGKVFKFWKKQIDRSGPAWAFNNSYYLRCNVLKKGVTKDFVHYGNALQFCDPGETGHGNCVCIHDRNIIDTKFLREGWDATVRFGADLSNRPWPERLETHQSPDRYVPDFSFRSPHDGDLHLPEGIDAPLADYLSIPLNDDERNLEVWTSPPGTIVGAWQSEESLIEGPAFRRLAGSNPADDADRPRIVRVDRTDEQIAIVFSVPLASATPVLVTVGDASIDAAVDGRVLTAPLSGPTGPSAPVILPLSLTSTDGRPITTWASPDPSISISDGSGLPG